MYKACKSQDNLFINGWACYQPSSVVPLSNKTTAQGELTIADLRANLFCSDDDRW